MSDHVFGSAPRTEPRFPSAAQPATRRRFVLTAALAALAGPALVPGMSSARQIRFAPAELRIPSVGIDASVEQVHIIDGVMEAPGDPWKVGWYSQLAFPGQGSNVVMAGHRDWWSVGPAVFWDLRSLEADDKIYLSSPGGEVMTYVVTSADELSAATPPSRYTTDEGGESLTLITCSGTFDGSDYDERLIVRASLA